jgi:hypothetical protein
VAAATRETIYGRRLRFARPAKSLVETAFGAWYDEAKVRGFDMALHIHPGEGIGPVRLGMRPAEVLEVFPEPQVYEDWMGGNLNDALLFHGLRLHFSDCDARAALPNSTLNWIVVHQRKDAFLFGQPLVEWTKEAVAAELQARGYDVQTPPNGDVEVPRQIGMSFDAGGRLIWVEL